MYSCWCRRKMPSLEAMGMNINLLPHWKPSRKTVTVCARGEAGNENEIVSRIAAPWIGWNTLQTGVATVHHRQARKEGTHPKSNSVRPQKCRECYGCPVFDSCRRRSQNQRAGSPAKKEQDLVTESAELETLESLRVREEEK